MAKDRAKFKSHLFTYILVNALLWAVWALTGRAANPMPWPVWVGAFWGIGVGLQAVKVYAGFGEEQQAEREYKKLLHGKEVSVRSKE